MKRPPVDQALVSVVLPVYNEGHVLVELLRRVERALRKTGARFEIIFVNDGSTDSSPRVLDQLARRHANVRVLHFSRNFGHQPAVQAGLAHARGDAVVLMDSDLQDEPEAIVRFVAEWQKGHDVVYAVRSERQEQWWKRCLFAGFHRTLAALSDVRIPVDAGNFCLIDARVARQITALGETDRYLPGLRSWVGFKQIGIPVRRNPRYDEKPRVSLAGLWRLAKTAIFSFSSFPLRVFYWIGFSSLAVFVGLSGFSLLCKLCTSLAIPGWTSQVLVASFFGAINALGISMLGEYVSRIYDQVRGRPLYIVDREVSGAGAAAPLIGGDNADAADGGEALLASQASELLDLTRQATQPQSTAATSSTADEQLIGGDDRATVESPKKVSQGGRQSGGRKAKQRRGR